LGRPGATPHKDFRIRDFESGVKKFEAVEAPQTISFPYRDIETFSRTLSLFA
jgi:hypothetical protein